MENIKEKFLCLIRYYATLLVCFVPLRLLFLAMNSTESYSVQDYIDTALHGLPLDIAVAGYLTAIPLLFAIAGIFVRTPLRKLLIPYNILAAIAIAAAFTADISLYPFWGFKLDASFLIYIDSPSNAFASVSTGYIVTRLLMAIALTAALFLALHKATAKELHASKMRIVTLSALILMGGVLFLGIRGGVGESTNNIGKVFHSDRQFLNHAAVNPVFSFIYSMGKREDYKDAYSFFDPAEAESRMAMLYPHDEKITDTLLTTTRPNIITIILEGMGSALIESQGGLKGVTPNFDKLTREGVIFTGCHANSYRTDRGVLCTLSGYASFPKTSVMKSPVKSRNLPSIASSLGKAGYHNAFLYGGDINFTNMKSYLYSTGYNELIADKDFTLQQQSTHLWGVTDHITFDSLYTIATSRPQEPWHITYLTLSSHEPWTVPYSRIPGDEIANSFAYTDSCLGNFIGRLKKSSVWDNTLVIMLPDHTLARYPKRTEGDEADHNRIPILMLGGAVREAKEIPLLCNQSDLPATLLAQLGLPADEFDFSRNILSPSYRYPFAYHTFNNGVEFTDSTGFSMLDLNAGTILKEEPADSAHSRLKRAKAILQSTYNDYKNR